MDSIIYTFIDDVYAIPLRSSEDDDAVTIDYSFETGGPTTIKYSHDGFRYILTRRGNGDITLAFDLESVSRFTIKITGEPAAEQTGRMLEEELTRLCGQDPWSVNENTIWPVMVSHIVGAEKELSCISQEPGEERPEDLPADAWTLIQE